MNLMEKLETRFDERIVFPDELAREAATEINRLRVALTRIRDLHEPCGVRQDWLKMKLKHIAKEALLNVPQKGGSNG